MAESLAERIAGHRIGRYRRIVCHLGQQLHRDRAQRRVERQTQAAQGREDRVLGEPGQRQDQPRIVGVVLALRIAAIRALGADFVSATVAPSRIVTTGVYRFLRHPSELGLITAAAGAAVLLDSRVAAGIALVVLVPLVVARCAAEDRLLNRMRDRPPGAERQHGHAANPG